VQIIECELNEKGQLRIDMALEKLFLMGVTSLFLECGPKLISGFLSHAHLQRLYHFIAPTIIGEVTHSERAPDFQLGEFDKRMSLHCIKFKHFGSDLLMTGRLQEK
jgi:riboflavin biosynthesis pyrimidine reductase